jgi:thymidylate synthase
MRPHRGIRHDYGDLGTVVKLLAKDLTTRQAYLPIFHPEDLMAAAKSERVPCSLGYHFICRQGRLDVMYPMRSCDFVRHFRDDVYLTSRLLLWVIKEMKSVSEDPSVQAVVPGRLIMHITSLHCFDSDNLDEL